MRNELRQLSYALRVATLSRHSALIAAVETHGIAPGTPQEQALALAKKGLWAFTLDGGETWRNDHGELAPQEDEATNAWLRKATAALACDPRGGAVDCGDVIDVHAYPGPWPKPKHRAEWYGGGLWEQVGWARNSRRASVLGEFGGVKYGLAGHTQTGDGWGYGKKDAADCADFVARIVEVWSRVPAALSGAVYTQLTDVEQEWNGLIAYDRHPKCETTLGPALRRVLAAVQRNASAAAAGGGRPVRLRPQSIFL